MKKEKLTNNSNMPGDEVAQKISLWDQMISKAKSLDGAELIEMLEKSHPSDVHLLLRDHISVQQIKLINADVDLKKKLADVRKKAKKLWDHDHRQATMMDVDKACTQVYRMCLTLVKGVNDGQTDVKEAINRIEKHLGIQETDWIAEIAKPSNTEFVDSAPVVDTPEES